MTGQTIYDHPLDEVYRKKFQEAKAEKNRLQRDGRLGGSNAHDSATNMSRMAGSFAPVFGAKMDDPLIKAETEKKFKEQKVQIEQEYRQSYDELERNFELRKKELIAQNQREIEREKDKWEQFKVNEEKKLRAQAESAADSKLQSFKDKLKLEEEKEVRNIGMQTEQRVRDYERDLEQKFEHEKRSLVSSYERIRRTVEESEQERFDFELEKFRNE